MVIAYNRFKALPLRDRRKATIGIGSIGDRLPTGILPGRKSAVERFFKKNEAGVFIPGLCSRMAARANLFRFGLILLVGGFVFALDGLAENIDRFLGLALPENPLDEFEGHLAI